MKKNNFFIIQLIIVFSIQTNFSFPFFPSFFDDEFENEMRHIEQSIHNHRKNVEKQFKNIEKEIGKCCVDGSSLKTSIVEQDDCYALSLQIPTDIAQEDIATQFSDRKDGAIISIKNDTTHIKIIAKKNMYTVSGSYGYSNKSDSSYASSMQNVSQSSSLAKLVNIQNIRIVFDAQTHTLNIYLPFIKEEQVKKTLQEIPVELQ